MTAILALGILLVIAGNVLDFKRTELIRRVTSRPLGSLAPGYAATPDGVRVYVYLVVTIGMVLMGLGITQWSTRFGGLLALCGMFAFAVFSVIAIAGEVRTYRALKR